MINIQDNIWIPSDSYKYLSNGETLATRIYLGKKDSIDNWHDTNDEPPEPEEPITDTEALNIITGEDSV